MKIGVIGLGEVSQLMHLPILSDMEGRFEVTAVSDVSPSLVEHIRQKYNVPAGYLSFAELIRDADTDAIMVLAPDQYHGEAIRLALAAGKHVFVEKPAALYSGELRELIDLKEKYPKQIVMVGYMRRYAGPFLKAKALLEESSSKTAYLRFRDIICEAPFYIRQTRKPYYPNDIPAEVLEEGAGRRREQLDLALGEEATDEERTLYQMMAGLGCHSFAAVRELFGRPQKFHSVTTACGGEHVVIVMEFEGFLATYELVNNLDIVQFDAAIEILQPDRKLLVKYETPYLRYQPARLEVLESETDETQTTVYGPDYRDAFQTELEIFHHCVQTGEAPKTTLADALEDLEMFEEIMEVFRKGAGRL